MMTDLNRISNLAIVGMDVVVPGGEGINQFGWLVYRGLLASEYLKDKRAREDAVLKTAQRVLHEVNLSARQVSVISLSPTLASVLKAGGIGDKIFDLSTYPNPVTAALATASDWLNCGEAEAVLLVETQTELETICATMLTMRNYAIDNAKSIYAVISGASEAGSPLTSQSVASACQNAIASARIQPNWIGLIETASLADSTINLNEAQGLLTTYLPNGERTSALSGGTNGLLGLNKTIWCLYQRIIPCVPNWAGPVHPDGWHPSPFYVPTESRTWFLPAGQNKRYAAINMLSPEGSFAHIILNSEISENQRPNGALKGEMFYLFPIGAESVSHLVKKMTYLQSQLSDDSDLAAKAKRLYNQFLIEKSSTKCTVCLLSHTPDELNHEISYAVKSIPAALERNSDWQTPLGSYYTPQPLGEKGGVAFVYPGAFNSYPGVGCDLFYLFPNLYDRFASFSSRMGEMLYEKLLYPRSMTALSQLDLNKIEAQLTSDPLAMIISGVSLAVVYTLLMREVFNIHPLNAFGYSLGEISMMFASSVWTKGDESYESLHASPLFRNRLAGPQNAVREYWQLPIKNQNDPQENLWSNYVLMAAPDKVRKVLAGQSRVFLTHINTPRQVVIAGDPAECRQVIDLLKCHALQAPFNYILHCAAMQSEYADLAQLLSWPVDNQPAMTLYSAATYQPMPIDQQSIASQIASGLCNYLDFPRLIQQAYSDGARIFIELGAGSNCTHWIDGTLTNQPHAAFFINRKGVDDYSSILRLLARMICHHVSVNINLLYSS